MHLQIQVDLHVMSLCGFGTYMYTSFIAKIVYKAYTMYTGHVESMLLPTTF